MKEISLTQGKVALVSDNRFEYLNQWKWQAHKSNKSIKEMWYAMRSDYRNGKRTIFMHQEIMGFPGCDIDHKDGDGLNNQDGNRC